MHRFLTAARWRGCRRLSLAVPPALALAALLFPARAAAPGDGQPATTGTMGDGANARLSLPGAPAPPVPPPARPGHAASAPGGSLTGPVRGTATGTGVGHTSQEGESKGGAP